MSGLRVVIAQNTSDNQWSGMGRWAHATADALRARGHTVTIWFRDAFRTEDTTGRVGVIKFPRALGRRLVAERAAYDVCIVHEPAGRWYGRARQRDPSLPPMILMCHNVEEHVFSQMRRAARRGCAHVSLGSRWRTPLFRLPQSRGAIRNADHVVCLSRRDHAWLREHVGLPADRVTWLVNGAPRVSPPRDDPAGPPRVLFVGGWLDVKGRRVLPRLWSALRARHPDARLTVAGTGASPEAVLGDFAPDTRASVTGIPRLNGPDAVLDQMRAHHALVVPSVSEGSPLVVLEAMATGLPIAAAAVGGIPDAVRDRREALLFSPCDAVAGARMVSRLLADRPQALRLAEAARHRASSFTWDRVAAALARIAYQVSA